MYAALQTEFIARINDVGVDINVAVEHPHLLPCVQFVAGLGPRKAAGLIKVYYLCVVCVSVCVCVHVRVCACVCECLCVHV